MDTRPYEISFDESQKILHITLYGIWDLATVQAYKADLLLADQRNLKRIADSLSIGVLVDMREHGVQPKEVTEALIALVEAQDQRPAAAILSASALKAMQTRRVGGSIEHRGFFSNIVDATAWLSAEQKKRIG